MNLQDGKTPNRFLVWAAIGVIGAPLSAVPLIALSGKDKGIPVPAPIATDAQPAQGSGVNMANYNRIKNGMSYEKVVAILGEQGVEMSSNDIGGYKTVMYMWKAGGFSAGNMNAMFQNGSLIQKAQFGLE